MLASKILATKRGRDAKAYDLCACGEPKCRVAKVCRTCYDRTAGRWSVRITCGVCGRRKHPDSFRCMACYAAMRAKERARLLVCPWCHGRKDRDAVGCWSCHVKRTSNPRRHDTCSCGRRKKSTSIRCITCYRRGGGAGVLRRRFA
jgi:hypothetical protein